MSQVLKPLLFEKGKLQFLDQRVLPLEEKYFSANSHEDCFIAIRDMIVRGAPLIGFVGIWGMALYAKNNPKATIEQFARCAEYLKSARPTAVNLAFEVDKALAQLNSRTHMTEAYDLFCKLALGEMDALYNKNLKMAQIADKELVDLYGDRELTVMTICNTGVLACGVLGTALGVISHLNSQKRIKKVFACETRPYLQGLRLTSFELLKEGINHDVVVEGAMSYILKNHKIDAIFVGADRIVANGDTANKIGTSTLSIVAKNYGVPFYVVAPISSFDTSMNSGEEIHIEMRPKEEITEIKGVQIAHPEITVCNPSFDVTDHKFITKIICENGAINPAIAGSVKSVLGV